MIKLSGFNRFAVWVVVGTALGCRAEAEERPVESESKAETAAEIGEISMVEVIAADAASHGLPPVSIQIDPGAMGLGAVTFPGDGQYLMLSGPPGGPLGMVIERVKGVAATDEALTGLAKKRFEGRTPLIGTAEEVEIAGEPRLALSCATDSSLSKSDHMLVIIPIPESKDSVLIDFWRGAGAGDVPTPADMLREARYGQLMKSLSIQFK